MAAVRRYTRGGGFTSAGGVSANRIAKWDGATWSAVGIGIDQFYVYALTVFDDGGGPALYAGGWFTNAGGVSANNIAKWDGATWSALGLGMSHAVLALTVFDDGGGPALYAGGGFNTAGGIPAANVAKWDGTSWSALGTGMNESVWALTIFDDGGGPALYAGGRFVTAGGVGANYVAKWDGASWSAQGRGMNGPVNALAVFDDGGGPALYAGGEFTKAGNVSANYVAKWDGATWSAVGTGMNNPINALTVFDDGGGPTLYAGGTGNYVAKWDGAIWGLMGGWMDSPVNALAVFDDGSGPALYAGGWFTNAGGVSANHIAKWDGASWSALGTGMNASVWALTIFDDGGGPALYAGGEFTNAGGVSANYVAKWDGATWSAVGTGMNNPVNALTVFNDGGGPALCAGGFFTNAGGVSANYVAKWDGATWSAVGTGMNNPVNALTVFNDGGGPALYAGGWFINAGGVSANYIAKWDGASWSALGTGMNSGIRVLTGFDDGGGPALYAGGEFSEAGGVVAGHTAKWVTTCRLYVDVDASGAADGTSWADAYPNLQDALVQAAAVGGTVAEIWVAEGTYMPDGGRTPVGGTHVLGSGDRSATFQLLNGWAVYGGFAGYESSRVQRNVALNNTILSGDLLGDDAPIPCTQDSPDCDSFGGRCLDGFCLVHQNNSENSYHVVAGSGTDSTAVLDGFTITAGNADGIPFLPGNNLGGGMYNNAGSPTVVNCRFTSNSADLGGGGMYNADSDPVLRSCTVLGSRGYAGGGMYNVNSSPTISDSTFDGNSAFDGGGVSNESNSNLTLKECTLRRNYSAGYGGAISDANNSSVNAVNCTFFRNAAATGGGAIGNHINSTATLTNCTFSGNVAPYGGGIENTNDSNLTVADSTFSGNQGISAGGGLYCGYATVAVVTNCILWGNSDAGGMDESAQIHTNSSTAVVNYSIVQGGWTGAGGTGNSNSDPLFVRNPDDGGDGWGDDAATPDIDEGTNDDFGDLRLLSGSPAIDAGDNDAVPPDSLDLDGDADRAEPTPFDLDGNSRFFEDLLAGGAGGTGNPGTLGLPIVDMGAYEFLRDCDGNGIPDDQDLANCVGDPDCGDCWPIGVGNDIPDACDIADCEGVCVDMFCVGGPNAGSACSGLLDCMDLSCNDCNLNGVPDGCDDPADNEPDLCASPVDTGNWSDSNNWELGGDYPDNVGHVMDQNVTIDKGESITLDTDVEIDTLRIIDGATLDVTGGDLTVVDPGGILVDGSRAETGTTLDVGDGQIVNTTNLTITGNENGTGPVTADGSAVINISDTLNIDGGGEYRTAGPASSAQLNAGSATLTGGDANVTGGTMTLTDSMGTTTTGDFVMDGSGAGPCNVVGLRVPSGRPPILAVLDHATLDIGGNLVLIGSTDVTIGPNAVLHVNGNFDNQSTSPDCFDWGNGALTFGGGARGMRRVHTFEMAGADYGPNPEGFVPPGTSHTNFSIGTVEIPTDASVTFVDAFDNDGQGEGFGLEALYVYTLILRAGSAITIDNCMVHYAKLIDEGATVTVLGAGELSAVSSYAAAPLTAPFPHDRRKNRYISFDPNKAVNDGVSISFKVKLRSINQGSCDDGTGAQGGNVDFCRSDRGAADCKSCSTSGDSCISASIDCPPGESCDPTGAVCVNDLPNSGGSNVGLIWWVGPEKDTATDPSLNIHLLVSEPFRKVSTDWPNPVHAGDCEVVPQASYGVRAINVDSGAESDELVVLTTALNVCSVSGELCNVAGDCSAGETCDPVGSPAPFWWGDVVGVLAFHCNGDIREQTCNPNTSDGDCTGAGNPAACCTGVGTGLCDCPGGDHCERAWELPNGVTNVDDVTAALWTSAPAPPTTVAAEFTWVDVHGNDSFTSGSQNFDPPNNKINASDLQQIISGFGGFPYKFYDPADCPDVGAWP